MTIVNSEVMYTKITLCTSSYTALMGCDDDALMRSNDAGQS
jgi:hypothetical protein